MQKALIVTTDGELKATSLPDDEFAQYNLMRATVGGLIEAVPLDDSTVMWVNEEGKLHGLPANEKATSLAAGRIFPGDYIAGQAIITGHMNDTGETVGISPQRYSELTGLEV